MFVKRLNDTVIKSHVSSYANYQIMIKFLLVLLTVLLFIFDSKTELWKQDVTSQIKIGLATTGYERIDLKCGADSFFVNITLNSNFEGIAYTRGSYDNKTSLCFKDHTQGVLQLDKLLMSMKIPFHQCQTIMDVGDSRYTNTLIVQFDPEFIMPGDAAFSLDCAFKPEFKITTDIVTEPLYRSKITLVDADISSVSEEQYHKYFTQSEEENVSFFPLTKSFKDEL